MSSRSPPRTKHLCACHRGPARPIHARLAGHPRQHQQQGAAPGPSGRQGRDDRPAVAATAAAAAGAAGPSGSRPGQKEQTGVKAAWSHASQQPRPGHPSREAQKSDNVPPAPAAAPHQQGKVVVVGGSGTASVAPYRPQPRAPTQLERLSSKVQGHKDEERRARDEVRGDSRCCLPDYLSDYFGCASQSVDMHPLPNLPVLSTSTTLICL